VFLILLMRFLPPIAINVGPLTGFKFAVGKETASLQELVGLRADLQASEARANRLEAEAKQLEADKKDLARKLAAVVPQKTTDNPNVILASRADQSEYKKE
jgi:hypothetical protein